MKFDLQRTIVAVSSGATQGRRAIVRLSGLQTHSILSRLFQGGGDQALLQTTVPRALRVTCSVGFPDRIELSTVPALAYYWPDSRSFTGEPCAELHLIGSMPIVEALVATLCSMGAAPAERGEFTLRSFLAGKVDLIQAEAVLSVIEAEGPAQLQEALSQLGGNLSKPVRAMRDQLVDLIAHLEAGLDFVEEDIQFINAPELILQLTSICGRLAALSQQLNTRDVRSRTAQIVIVGLPNSGKSSLFNRLVGSERAIVSPIAGTTRDAVAQAIDLEGLNVELFDTAGIEELQGDTPRVEAQAALQRRLTQADIALFCVDHSLPLDATWLAAQTQSLCQFGVSVLTVGTKSELPTQTTQRTPSEPALDILVSVCTGSGIAQLQERLAACVASHRAEYQSTARQYMAVRCRQSLDAATSTLRRAIALADACEGEELVAAELRMALDDLSSLIGEVHSDDILGAIFSRFCIGK